VYVPLPDGALKVDSRLAIPGEGTAQPDPERSRSKVRCDQFPPACRRKLERYVMRHLTFLVATRKRPGKRRSLSQTGLHVGMAAVRISELRSGVPVSGSSTHIRPAPRRWVSRTS